MLCCDHLVHSGVFHSKSDILIKTGKHQYITWWQCLKLKQKRIPCYSNTWKSKGYTFQGFQIEKKRINKYIQGYSSNRHVSTKLTIPGK